MEQNVGRLDRIVRFLLGVALLLVALSPFAGLVNLGGWSTLWLWALPGVLLLIAVLLLVTGTTGRSLVYRWVGIDTSEHLEQASDEAGSDEGESATADRSDRPA